ncbi:MAG TPA: signal peptide peptidase SppA [Vicinamibacterales bacterium]|nr:signal peptide peptidase SppA [Vicinamibacterales bacterium]
MARRRGIIILFSLIGLALIVPIAGAVLLLTVASRGPSIVDSSTLVLRPQGALRETAPGDVVGQIIGRQEETIRALVRSLNMARRDSRITSVLLMPTTLDVPYWAKLQELRDAVLDFRRSGKKVVAFLEYGGDREYYVASAADRVYLLPTSPLDLTGVASFEIFLRGTLDKLGLYPDFVHIGDYKTAPNQLTEKSMTPAHREMSESLNRDMYEQLVRGIAEGRNKTEAEVRKLLDEGPFTPEDALRGGLVDDLAYEDQLDDRVPELRESLGRGRRVDGSDYERVRPSSIGIRPRSRIAVLYAVGTIVSGRSGFDPVNGDVVGSETMVEQIRRIRDDDSIKAIILRVDSPGGSAVASDVIWRELMITRDAKPARPLVTSMSDLAASGGYYIAMPGQVIVAQPGTLTGSIGIYSGKIVMSGAATKIGVTHETIKGGANSDIYSPFSPYTPAQRAKVTDFMQSFYDGFVEKAAEARGTTPERIDAIGQGRVWTGVQAKAQGLVDELGGLGTAVAIAKKRANIPDDEDVELVPYPPPRTFYEAFAEQFGGSRVGSLWTLLDARGEALTSATSAIRLFRRGEPLALMPVLTTRVR